MNAVNIYIDSFPKKKKKKRTFFQRCNGSIQRFLRSPSPFLFLGGLELFSRVVLVIPKVNTSTRVLRTFPINNLLKRHCHILFNERTVTFTTCSGN